jgi:hypothetical protein
MCTGDSTSYFALPQYQQVALRLYSMQLAHCHSVGSSGIPAASLSRNRARTSSSTVLTLSYSQASAHDTIPTIRHRKPNRGRLPVRTGSRAIVEELPSIASGQVPADSRQTPVTVVVHMVSSGHARNPFVRYRHDTDCQASRQASIHHRTGCQCHGNHSIR